MKSNKKTMEESNTPSDKLKDAKKKACGGECIAPTICKDVFMGECAVEVMSEKMNRSGKPGTSDYAPKGKY